MSNESHELPLFPLNVVLFPGMPLSLRIFEDRYRVMIGRCLENKDPFGVVLIKQGRETGESAIPFSIGTKTQFEQVDRLDNGKINILTRGLMRFRIDNIIQTEPYLIAMTSDLPDPEEQIADDFVIHVRQTFSEYVKILLGLQGNWVRDVPTPTEPTKLSYFIAHTLSLELPNKQRLLETITTQERLERELFILAETQSRLKEKLESKHNSERRRLN